MPLNILNIGIALRIHFMEYSQPLNFITKHADVGKGCYVNQTLTILMSNFKELIKSLSMEKEEDVELYRDS